MLASTPAAIQRRLNVNDDWREGDLAEVPQAHSE
jgi:hypothetical protein